MDSDVKLQDGGILEMVGDQIRVSGNRLEAVVNSAWIGSNEGGRYKGITVSTSSGYIGFDGYVGVRDPMCTDSVEKVALMHGQLDDDLELNVCGYRGGVKINGPVRVKGNLVVQEWLTMAAGSKLLFSTPSMTWIDPVTKKKKRLPGRDLDLLETIKNLQDRIAALESKVP